MEQLYIDGFKTILDDLDDRLVSSQLVLCEVIEEFVLNAIVAPKREIATNLIKDKYSTSLHKVETLKLEVLDNGHLRGELEFLSERERWVESGRGNPQTF